MPCGRCQLRAAPIPRAPRTVLEAIVPKDSGRLRPSIIDHDRHHYRGVFGSLRFVDRNGEAQRHLVEFAEAVAHRSAVEVDRHLRGVGIDGGDEAECTLSGHAILSSRPGLPTIPNMACRHRSSAATCAGRSAGRPAGGAECRAGPIAARRRSSARCGLHPGTRFRLRLPFGRSARWALSVRGKFFCKPPRSRASCAGCRGRALTWEKPSSFSSVPT